MNRWLAVLAVFVCFADTAAATTACRSSPGKDDYYRYRLVDGRKCWTRGHEKIDKSELYWKSENRRAAPANPAATAAGEAPGPSTLAVGPENVSSAPSGGSMVRTTSASASRRGEPAPDFDAVFAHWPEYAVAHPPIHLLHPKRVSQAYGARPVALVLYRKPE